MAPFYIYNFNFQANYLTPLVEAQNLPHPFLEHRDLRRKSNSREDGANPTPTLHGVMTDGSWVLRNESWETVNLRDGTSDELQAIGSARITRKENLWIWGNCSSSITTSL